MAMPNVKLAYEVKPESHAMLGRIAERHEPPVESKAWRCLLDHATMEGDWDEIFGKIRCRRPG